MFQTARIKLTAWYLLIIMTVSLAFSVVIYTWTSREIERFARTQRFRIERRFDADGFFYKDVIIPPHQLVDPDLIAETKQHILVTLAGINGIIVFLAGILGYMLSGKTLEPIQQMISDQQRFISDASHELRTPLAALQSSLEVNMRDPHLSITEAKSLMQAQLSKVNELHALTEQLLHLNKNEQTVSTQKFSHFDTHIVIEKAIETIKPLAQLKDITINSNLSSVTINGNPESIHEVCIILLDNAVKYSTPQTTITVISKKSSNNLKLTITDQGEGISKKDLPHIFDRFFRSDQARSKDGKNGFGLGLAIAKEIITHHHGSIKVKSSLGKGTSFTITIPLPHQHYHS